MARLSRQTKSQPDVSIRRTLFVAAFVAFWMLGIGARLVYLQVSRHEKLRERAHQQQQDAIETTPTRGLVLDRQDRELARTIDTTSVFVAPDFEAAKFKARLRRRSALKRSGWINQSRCEWQLAPAAGLLRSQLARHQRPQA